MLLLTREARARLAGCGYPVPSDSTQSITSAHPGASYLWEHPDIVARCVDVFLHNGVSAYVETCRMLGAADLRESLPRMSMPAAIVVGDEDYATPVAMAEALHRALAGSTLRVLQGARHLTPLEAPDAIAEELIVLLKRAKDRVEKP